MVTLLMYPKPRLNCPLLTNHNLLLRLCQWFLCRTHWGFSCLHTSELPASTQRSVRWMWCDVMWHDVLAGPAGRTVGDGWSGGNPHCPWGCPFLPWAGTRLVHRWVSVCAPTALPARKAGVCLHECVSWVGKLLWFELRKISLQY